MGKSLFIVSICMCKSRMKLAIITRNVLQGMCLYKLNETYCEFAGFFLLLFFCVCFLLTFRFSLLLKDSL